MRTVQGKTDFVGGKYILKKIRKRRGTEGCAQITRDCCPRKGIENFPMEKNETLVEIQGPCQGWKLKQGRAAGTLGKNFCQVMCFV